jgi:hypothetical protein
MHMKIFGSPRISALKHVAGLLVSVGLAHGAQGAQTTVFEWRDAQGVVSYSQSAPPAAVKNFTVKKIETQSFTAAQQQAIKAQLAYEDAEMQAESTRFRHRVASADALINAAIGHLARAEQALKAGREPRPGERKHNAGGGSRLLQSFFERQSRLDEAARQAREQLAVAYREREAIRP